MKLVFGILIGAFVAGMYFNPEATKQTIADGADWVKGAVSDDEEISFVIPKELVDIFNK